MKMKSGNEKFLLFGTVKGFIFISCVFFMDKGYAGTGQQTNSLAEYKKLIAEQQKEFQVQRQIIAEQGKELERLKSRLDTLTNQGPGNKDQIMSAKNNNEPSVIPNRLPSKPVGQAPPGATEKPRPPEIPRLSDTVGGVLTRKGKIVVEPSLQYAYTSNNRVFLDAFTFLPAIAIGLIDLREVKRHSFIGTLGVRYGVTDRLEVEFRAPYVYRSDSQRSRPVSIGAGVDETFNASGNDIGDLEFASRYQLNSGSGGWPILVGNIVATAPTGKSPFDVELVQAQGVPGATFPTELPTGAGYFSFQPSLTALYPTDPAVFFGNLSYSYNAETNTSVGKINPGNALGLSFGMGFGINERSSFSLGYSHKHVLESEIKGIAIKGSALDIGQLLVGYSFKYSPKTTFNLSLGIGTTTDAQDVTLNFRMPMTFDFI
ncbi:MAG: transporter [Methylobacter sp.]|nr:transporter [Methylobacter sp.]